MKSKKLAKGQKPRQKELLLKRQRSYLLRVTVRGIGGPDADRRHVLLDVPLVDFLRDRLRPKILSIYPLTFELRPAGHPKAQWFEVI